MNRREAASFALRNKGSSSSQKCALRTPIRMLVCSDGERSTAVRGARTLALEKLPVKAMDEYEERISEDRLLFSQV